MAHPVQVEQRHATHGSVACASQLADAGYVHVIHHTKVPHCAVQGRGRAGLALTAACKASVSMCHNCAPLASSNLLAKILNTSARRSARANRAQMRHVEVLALQAALRATTKQHTALPLDVATPVQVMPESKCTTAAADLCCLWRMWPRRNASAHSCGALWSESPTR